MALLAHLSDPHLGPLPRARLQDLAGKRVLGFLNWKRGRAVHHRSDVLDSLVTDLAAQHPDHVAVTGDLVNIGLESEYPFARAWLERLGAPTKVSVVPGNHDAYVRENERHLLHHWGEYMRGDGIGHSAPAGVPTHFPYVRRRAPIAIVGLSSAVPTAPFMATGKLGADQLMRLGDVLRRLDHEGLFRVVLIHHCPIGEPADRFKRLVDSGPFRRVLRQAGAELVLHGHNHVRQLNWIDGPAGMIPVVGVPSASAAPGLVRQPAGYHLYRISGSPGAWRCEMFARGFRPGRGGIVEIERGMIQRSLGAVA